jgi:hypothetical protein
LAQPQRPQASGQPTSLPAMVNDLWETVLAYFKQQTVDPLKQLGRYVEFGVAGGVCIGVGLVVFALGGLRAIQTELASRGTSKALPGHGHLSGDWTWAPYFATAMFCALVAAIAASRISKVPSSEKR